MANHLRILDTIRSFGHLNLVTAAEIIRELISRYVAKQYFRMYKHVVFVIEKERVQNKLVQIGDKHT